MMKKILFAAFLLISIFFLSRSDTQAACNNSYYCIWDDGSGYCYVDNNYPDYCCMYGYHNDPTVCSSKTTPDSCQSGVHQCIQDNNPPAGYDCTTNGVCNPTPTGQTPQYTDAAACHAACTGQVPTKFACDSKLGCVESQTGSYSNIGDCTMACKIGGSSDIHGDCGNTGIKTAIGCISVLGTPEAFLGDILRWAVGIGGGIAFLLILYAGFMVMTSAGNPERLKAGQELLTSAISGLILLIFSVFILKFIGVDILGLGAFGFGK